MTLAPDNNEEVHLEPLPPGSSLARIGGKGWKLGDAYRIWTAVVPIKACIMKGLDKTAELSELRKLKSKLAAEGYELFGFVRNENGKSTWHWHWLK